VQDQLIYLQILVLLTGILYIVDMKRLSTVALSVTSDSSVSLRSILESKSIPKVGFNIRTVSKLLFRDFNISLNRIYNLQLIELISRDYYQSKKHLTGFVKYINQDILKSNTTKYRWL
jgi:exonuclease 3'-5' domain-containing protein 1